MMENPAPIHPQSRFHSDWQKRGNILSIYLIIMSIIMLGLLFALSGIVLDAQNSPDDTGFSAISLIAAAVGFLIAIIGIWFWKRWGLYVFAVATVVWIAANLTFQPISVVSILFPITQAGVMYWVIGDKVKWFT